MTVTIEVTRRRRITRRRIRESDGDARANAKRETSPLAYSQAEVARRVALINALPTTSNRAGLPELDLSGSRADVYGYTEREDAQL